jgi:aldose 1-epimerase
VTYTLTPDGELWIEMESTTDTPTLVNLVHHTYWNIAGQATNGIENHTLQAHADRYLPLDRGGIPTGIIRDVDGTPFDFRFSSKAQSNLGQVIRSLTPSPEGAEKGGVDHCLIINNWKPDGALRPAVILSDPASGRSLEILTDQPGIQVYTGNYLDSSLTGKSGTTYREHAAICLETECFPNAINQTDWHGEWPSGRLNPGETYKHTMVHRFTTGY